MSAQTSEAATANTFPQLLLHHAAVRGERPAIREKDLGIWQTWTWAEVAAEVRALACGLAAQGLKRGEHLAVIGENRPRLYWTMTAAQCLGAIPVPLYQDAVAAEMVYVFKDAGIARAVVEDQEQVDKVLEVAESVPGITHIYYDDGRGLRNYAREGLMAFDELQRIGREYDRQHPEFFRDAVAQVKPEDTAAMFYTSGTTGHPKGVVHSQGALIDRSRAACVLEGLTDHEEILAYLPPAWIGQNIFSYAQAYVAGYCVNCPESPETVSNDMREIGPTYYFAPPRVLEALLTTVTIRMEDASAPKRAWYKYFMNVATRVGGRLLDGQHVGIGERLLYALGDFSVYAPLRNALGMSRLKVSYTAGEAIGPDLFRFYRSIGINLKQLYGSTETAVFVCIQPDGQVRADTVGPPVPGVEIKIADSGELLIKSPGLLKEYYKNPAATAEVLTADGWYHTGDAGYLDLEGHLKIIDRAKDVGKMADGTLFAPKYLENKLKFFPYIKEAVAFGDARDRVCAFINIDMEAVSNWAEKQNIPYAGYLDLTSRPEVYALIRDCVEKANADLATDPKIANSQISRFVILHKELDADDGELTRTRKVRRGYIGDKYGVLVDAMYGNKHKQFIETRVKFEDGREGMISAELKIMDVTVYPAVRAAA